MFKRIFFILIFFLFTFYLSTQKVSAEELIKDFSSKIIISSDAKVNVSEKIIYDFGETKRRGIIREIPIVYKNEDGKKFKVDLKVNGVTDEFGKSYAYKVSEKEGRKIIRIGKEDLYIEGSHTYILDYALVGVITYFSDHDEFYWNVTGNEWTVPILSSSLEVYLPKQFSTNDIRTACFVGSLGSTDNYCSSSIDGEKIIFSSQVELYPNQGLTIVVGFPKNTVEVVEPKEVIDFWETRLGKLIAALFALLAFFYYTITPFIMFLIWFKFGRDPKVDRPVRSWYDPPKDNKGNFLKASEVGTLVDEHADDRDISATIVDLAIKGFFKIKEEKKGKVYSFIKLKDYSKEKLSSFEEKILGKFFHKDNTISTDDLKKTFYTTSAEVKEDLYNGLVTKGYFPKSPKKTRDIYYILGVVALFTGNILLAISLFVFGRSMPRKTIFGAVSQNTALGLKNFLTSQGRQLKYQANNWYLFEKLLPYAIVFNVEKVWADRFKNISSQPPSWYEGSYSGHFNSFVFVNNLTLATSNFASIATPPSSTRSSSGFSSGFSGGSSGGGFGGGGGSSW